MLYAIHAEPIFAQTIVGVGLETIVLEYSLNKDIFNSTIKYIKY